MRNWNRILLAAVLALSAAAFWNQNAFAREPAMQTKDERNLDREARRLDGEANTPAGEQQVLTQMSSQLGVPVQTLQQQKQSSGLSFGNLFIANALAKSSGKSFDQILAARRSGQGWGQIANANNVRLGTVVSQLRRSSRSVDHAERQQREEARERSQSGGNGRGRTAEPNTHGPMTGPSGMAQAGRGGVGGGRRR